MCGLGPAFALAVEELLPKLGIPKEEEQKEESRAYGQQWYEQDSLDVADFEID